MHHARITAPLFCALILAASGALAAQLDVKPGLWESTITTESSGMPPIDTSRMTPEQKARLEAAFKRRQAQGPHSRTTKSCMTKEKLAKEPFADAGQNGETCITKMISQSSTHWQGDTVCTGSGHRREIDMDFSALSRERIKGTTRVSMSGGGREMKVRGTVSGKWLGSDCGSVR